MGNTLLHLQQKMKTRKEGGVSCLLNLSLISGLRFTLVLTLHKVSAHYWGAPVAVWGLPLGSSIRAGKITSVLNFWTTAFRARLQRNTDHSWGRSFWPLTGLTRTMPLKHLCFHFLFWFECLRKRILLLGSWIPNIKDWVCVWVPKESWPVSPYHQSCTLSTSAFRVQLFFPSLQKLFIIFLA